MTTEQEKRYVKTLIEAATGFVSAAPSLDGMDDKQLTLFAESMSKTISSKYLAIMFLVLYRQYETLLALNPETKVGVVPHTKGTQSALN